MILNRLGNKTRIAHDIIKYFPPHTTYIEPFFGAGGMFFSKPKAKYNILNDLDEDVFNLFFVLKNDKDELYRSIHRMPIHEALWQHWRKNKEVDPVMKAVRFLFLSNFGYMGKGETLRFCNGNQKKLLLDYIDLTYLKIWDCEFSCVSFEKVISKIPKADRQDKQVLFYFDPPYLDTTNNYSNSFTEENSKMLFDDASEMQCNWAMSEFDHPFIIDQATKRGLNIVTIGERLNMKNRRTEVLITNYSTAQQTLF
jgi:DNA adenine methylase